MPTVYATVTSTTAEVIYKPPAHRKIKVIRVHVYNEDTAAHKVTVLAARVASDGSISSSRTVDYISLGAGTDKDVLSDVAVYDLDKGEAIAVALDAATTANPVHVSVTYELV